MNNDRIAGAANDAAGKVEGRGDAAIGVVQDLYGQAKDVARDAGEAASNIAKDAMDTGTEYYREGSRALASTVEERPLGSLLVAGAVGFMLALMLNRSPRRRDLRDDYTR
ncbi:CsbD family protein [Bradyrhizobium sp. SYSU BS000235]|uniref:CsbD family protein n=1 Tax=Bradyrhizobium sp. SYSU BS000235 TaxID=3411332 RepID=UPI003C750360